MDDVDAHYAWAKAAGAKLLEVPHETAYGEHRCAAEDLDGHRWLFSRHATDRSPEELGGSGETVRCRGSMELVRAQFPAYYHLHRAAPTVLGRFDQARGLRLSFPRTAAIIQITLPVTYDRLEEDVDASGPANGSVPITTCFALKQTDLLQGRLVAGVSQTC